MTMLRITRSEGSEGVVELRLSGSLSGLWVAELASAFAESTGPVPSRLDLSEVTFADSSGVCLLTRLREAGVAFAGTAPFVAAQLCDGAQHLVSVGPAGQSASDPASASGSAASWAEG